ncbi:hypothetical protein IV203_010761 [Nitzschia inconspicua]|uniref:CBF1-interacting co-repressor CIR N-terminal domain-containing protein n=1 Tax=Nitzschia inconspicua TaxID=303405 RepID=A0A9K3PLR1_9STRA|nr:hypothetical protein IV203_010761 [Nitzschia inconspicua]
MSGRLIILPKKSYCPWNAKNLERVERDEKEHREQQERDAKQQSNEEAQTRLERLRKRSRGDGGHNDSGQERFNLFEKEEQESHTHAQQEGLLPENQAKRRNNSGEICGGRVQKRRNNSDFPNRNDEVPFYLKSTSDLSRDITLKETRLKEHLDPMKEFQASHTQCLRQPSTSGSSEILFNVNDHTAKKTGWSVEESQKSYKQPNDKSLRDDSSSSPSSSSQRRARNRKHKKDKKKKKKESRKHHKRNRAERPVVTGRNGEECLGSHPVQSTAGESLEELRRRRAEREETERKRQEDLMGNPCRQNQRYFDQYNPRLSRN